MPYSHNIINDHKATEKVWKTQLNMHVLFVLKILEKLAPFMY